MSAAMDAIRAWRTDLARKIDRVSEAAQVLDDAEHQLGQHYNELEPILDQLEAELNQSPAPEPEPETSLNLASFWYTPNLPPGQEQYEFLCLQRPATGRLADIGDERRIAWYSDPVVRRPTDPNGYTQCLPPAQVTNAMCYNLGGFTRPDNGGEAFVNPGHDGYIAAVSQWLPKQCVGADLVLFDEIDEDPTWGRWRGSGPFPSKGFHQANLIKFLAQVGAVLRSQGYGVGVNLGANLWPISPFVSLVLDNVDTVWLEQFICRELSNYAQPATIGDMWQEQMNFLAYAQTQGVDVVVNAATADVYKMNYAYYSYLLVASSTTAFGSQRGGNGSNNSTAHLKEWTQNLGPATSTWIRDTDAKHYRNFEGGTVHVFPTATEWRQSHIEWK